MIRLFIFVCLLSNATCLLALDTIYVKPSAQADIERIIDHVPPHTIIKFAPGNYKIHDLIIRKPLTLYGIEQVVFDGQQLGSVLVLEGRNIHVKGLTIKNTGYSSVDERAGIKLLSAYGCIIEDVNIRNTCFGISLVNASNCVVINNNIHAVGISEQRSGNAIHAWKSDSLTIKNNTVSGHRDGIYFEFVSKTGVYMNNSSDNLRYGIHFMFSNDDEYVGNVFDRNGSGVAVMFSSRVHIRDNTFSQGSGAANFGILLKEINDCEVSGNTFRQNTNGLYMEGTNRVYLLHNLFTENGWACRVQASCSSVIVRGNNFIGNSFDMATNGSLAGQNFNGNYWDTYSGYDMNKDGTGDIPHSPVSMYSMIVERMPYAIMLYRSFTVFLLDRSERIMPGITTEQVKDLKPAMQAFVL
ncbi:MAG TPA: nitrous oxide reductase family maturation protein NosD [Chitinophagales bacterium]|nr:nitrous oxide reductase family maturation protein NosD [Chitinophagales bacterium]